MLSSIRELEGSDDREQGTPKDGKIQVFNCYPSVFVMLWQLGAVPDLKGSLKVA